MKKPRDGTTANSGEWVLDVRVGLVDSEPEIWRQLELRGSLTLVTVHRILQVAFGWKDANLHRFTDSDPLALLRPIDGEIPDALQWLPAEWCEEPTDLAEEFRQTREWKAATSIPKRLAAADAFLIGKAEGHRLSGNITHPLIEAAKELDDSTATKITFMPNK